mmetsp:Transcript_32262/g.77025  ORF Transcript_32262/g.77025 Transcript_32262/m.77025 type:complete len:599 (+) Transcript_32262:29-1825(+)
MPAGMAMTDFKFREAMLSCFELMATHEANQEGVALLFLLGVLMTARGFAVMKTLFVSSFSLTLTIRLCVVASQEAWTLVGLLCALMVLPCAVIVADRLYPVFAFALGCCFGAGAVVVLRVPLGLASEQIFLGFQIALGICSGAALLQLRMLGWRLSTPLLGGLLVAASLRFAANAALGDSLGSFLDFLRIDGDLSDPIYVLFLCTWGICSLLGWFSQFSRFMGLEDPCALPKPLVELLKRAQECLPFFSDSGEEFAERLLPEWKDAHEPFLAKPKISAARHYETAVILVISVLAVLLLSCLIVSRPMLVGHIVLMSFAFVPLVNAGMLSYAPALRHQDRNPWLRHMNHASFNIMALLCALGGYLCMQLDGDRQTSETMPERTLSLLHVWLGYAVLGMFFILTFTGVVKLVATLGDGNSSSELSLPAAFHGRLAKWTYGLAAATQISGYFMKDVMPRGAAMMMTSILIAVSAATCQQMRNRTQKEGDQPAVEDVLPIKVASASSALTRMNSDTTVRTASSSSGKPLLLSRSPIPSFNKTLVDKLKFRQFEALLTLYFSRWQRNVQSIRISCANAEINSSSNLVDFLSSAIVSAESARQL